MENLVLIKPAIEYADEITAYKKEFDGTSDRLNGASGLEKYNNIREWIDRCRLFEKRGTMPDDQPEHRSAVEAEQFMLVRKDDNKILGMINFRHELNEYLAEYGGHIGYSVRPSERRRGYAARMLAICLDRCGQFGLDKVLITCMSGNEASRKTIIKNGGVYERTTHLDSENVDMERYWITIDRLGSHYGVRDEDGRFNSRHGSVEFRTSMRYIERFLKPLSKVLDIGAGTGRYSLALADAGYEVTAVELLPHHIGIFKTKIKPEHRLSLVQGTALDLSRYSDGSFDLTLLFGPMYHLYTESDKRRALSEAFRVTKKGGIVFIAYCLQDASIIQYGFQGGHMDEIFEKKMLDPETFKVISVPAEVFELCRKEDIDFLMRGFDAERLHYVAVDLFSHFIRDTLISMDERIFEIYLKYHFSICERQDMAGISNHVLDIWRKN